MTSRAVSNEGTESRPPTIPTYEQLAARIRLDIIDLWKANHAPFSGSYSIVESYIALLFDAWDALSDGVDSPAVIPKVTSANAWYAAICRRAGRDPSTLLDWTFEGCEPFPAIPHRQNLGGTLSAHKLGNNLDQAIGVARSRRARGSTAIVIVFMSDGELQCGVDHQAKLAAQWELSNLVVVLDANALQSNFAVADIDPTMPRDGAERGSFIRLRRLWAAYGWGTTVIDGHDVHAISQALIAAKETCRPELVVARTRKGCGISFVENKLSYNHGLSDEELRRTRVELQRAFAEAPPERLDGREIDRSSESHPAPALPQRPHGSGGLLSRAFMSWIEGFSLANVGRVPILNTDNPAPFELHDATRIEHLFVGINERVAINVARGLARDGNFPVYVSPATHLMVAVEEVALAGLDGDNVLVVGFNPGSALASWGPTHTAYRDALCFAAPGVHVFEPALEADIALILAGIYSDPDKLLPAYLRLSKRAVDGDGPTDAWTFARGFYELRSQRDAEVAFIASGRILEEARAAADALSAGGIGVKVINLFCHSLTRTDELSATIAGCKAVITAIDADPATLAPACQRAIPTGAQWVALGVRSPYHHRTRAGVYRYAGIDAIALERTARLVLGLGVEVTGHAAPPESASPVASGEERP